MIFEFPRLVVMKYCKQQLPLFVKSRHENMFARVWHKRVLTISVPWLWAQQLAQKTTEISSGVLRFYHRMKREIEEKRFSCNLAGNRDRIK
jgi:hypothetical protein